ncbi:MAG TPA: protein kinase [Kofleriaceae bacterium]|nr:protein kinase [Kofleriaceae bacterium]
MRPELDDTLAVPGSAPPGSAPDGSRTATSPGASGSGAAAPGLVAGQQLGHFRIEKPLGAGGMGEVYLATDLALDRPVAIKVLPGALARDPVRRDRMIREARAQARVSHPNVGHIYFIGEELGRLYFAMEYVAGQTVADRLAGGPLSIEDALSIIRSAAQGLREAQRSGITHRDIKPSNLMIDGHGMIKVLDFGLAAGGPGTLGDGPVAQTSLAGTPLYMAPEQARGEPVDFRADVYALGATLFHLVSGRPPFEADTLHALLTKHASANRPLLARRSGTPRTMVAAIDALVARMMAPVPADRFASYDELIRAIELTSVEHMRPAGFWVRSIATGVDFLIVLLVALAAASVIALTRRSNSGNDLFSALMFPIYGAGAIAMLVRKGRTPGQSLVELEVVDVATSARPKLRRAAIRVLVPIALPLIYVVLSHTLGTFGRRLGRPTEVLFGLVGSSPPVLLLWASLRSHGKQAVWDRLSGTMVRYRTRRTSGI